MSDLLGATNVGPLIEILKLFLSDIDLVATPTISGSMSTLLETDNSAISLAADNLEFVEGETSKNIKMDVLGGSTESGIRLTDMQYNLGFLTGWAIDFDFKDTMNMFVEDKSYDIGTFPDITESSDEQDMDAKTTTGYEESVALSVVEPEPTTSSTSSTTTLTSTLTGANQPNTLFPDEPGSMVIVALVIGMGTAAVAVVAIYFVQKKQNAA